MRATSRNRRCRGDAGVSAVEFAIVLPVLMILTIGMLEFAFVMRDWLSVSTSVRVGARTAVTGAGNGCAAGSGSTCVPAFTLAASDAMEKAGYGMPKSSIEYIMIYKANNVGFPGGTNNTTMPTKAQCGTSPYGSCVTYIWDQTQNAGTGGFVYSSGAWNSSQINACLPTPDDVGVYMRVNHPYLTKMFGATITISDRAVMRFEPLPANACAAGAHP